MARRGRPALLDQLHAAAKLDSRVRDITAARDALRARVSELSKEAGQLRRSGDAGGADELAAESRALGDRERRLDQEHEAVAAELRDVLLAIPNLPHPDAPDGGGEEDNP